MTTAAHDEKRSEPRRNSTGAIAFAFLNHVEHYVGMAQDVSRGGMFFHTSRQLMPGTIIRIQPLDCPAPPMQWGDDCRRLAAEICDDTASVVAARKDFANLVVAQVQRCETLGQDNPWRYGVGVSFVRPSL